MGSAAFAAAQPEEPTTSDGWTGLMRLAADFPLETLSFSVRVGDLDPHDGGTTGLPSIVLPKPRSFSSELSSECLADLVDSAGDGPLIGLGAGMSLGSR